MNSVAPVSLPNLSTALDAWKKLLAERKLSTDLLWIFEENLCFERKADVPGGVHIGFQTRFSPVPQESIEIAYEHFCESETPIVFYRLGESKGRSVCILLGDAWFDDKKESDDFIKQAKWGISFHPGQKIEIEEVSGEEVAAIVANSYAAPASIVEAAREAMNFNLSNN